MFGRMLLTALMKARQTRATKRLSHCLALHLALQLAARLMNFDDNDAVVLAIL